MNAAVTRQLLRLSTAPRFSSAIPRGSTRYASTSSYSEPVIKRKGGFRGGAVGFLLGASFAGAAGYYALLDEYQRASGLILSSVDSLHRSTVKIHDYVHKIEHIDHELTKLKEAMVTNDRHESLRRQVNELQAQVQKDGAVLRNELSQITQDATKVIDLALQKSYEN